MAAAPSVLPRVFHLFSESESITRIFSRMNEVKVLKEGYALSTDADEQRADGSITLVKGKDVNILVDTGLPKDKDFLCSALAAEGLTVDEISIVVGTHGHSDHIGNLSLFPDSLIIVGFDISKGDLYLKNDLKLGESYVLATDIEVIPTPGHTGNDISVVVRNTEHGTVVIAGDLFESEADIKYEAIWTEVSENPVAQRHHRCHVLRFADVIVPGHGPMFRVTEKYRNHLQSN